MEEMATVETKNEDTVATLDVKDEITPVSGETENNDENMIKIEENNEEEFVELSEEKQKELFMTIAMSMSEVSSKDLKDKDGILCDENNSSAEHDEGGSCTESVKDEDFIWEEYLEYCNADSVAQTAFAHVEQSVQSGFQEKMMLEVPWDKVTPRYWVASIFMTCGPLLRLRWLFLEEDRCEDFWCDASKGEAHPMGWSYEQGRALEPPPQVIQRNPHCLDKLEEVLENVRTVPQHLLNGEGQNAVERLKSGMKVEVEDEDDMFNLWVATIQENVGGRILLRYDTPDSSLPDFWLFYLSPRLYYAGWGTDNGVPWQYVPPSQIDSRHCSEEWEAMMEMAKEDARRLPLPCDLFTHDPLILDAMDVAEGQKLEAVDPVTGQFIAPATVARVQDKRFLVCLDGYHGREARRFWAQKGHSLIFYTGWASEHGIPFHRPGLKTEDKKGPDSELFLWDEYLKQTKSTAVPRESFQVLPDAKECGFEAGMMLETVLPDDTEQIGAATIEKVSDHLLTLRLDCLPKGSPRQLVSCISLDIFPIGWSESNGKLVKAPLHFHPPSKHITPEVVVQTPSPTLPVDVDPAPLRCWGPKIYFNALCYSGPHLSKARLATLPKTVGPGPVTLVLKEVLGMLISVAYKSTTVLKALQWDGKPQPGLILEILKAKVKSGTHRANVGIVTTADKMGDFCQSVCNKLQCCPHLFGPIPIGAGGDCPIQCRLLPKSNFVELVEQYPHGRPKGLIIKPVGQRPRKKKSRKHLFTRVSFKANCKPILKTETNGNTELMKEELHHNGDISLIRKRRWGRDDDDSEFRPKYKSTKKVIPIPSMMKTRGAKLPDFTDKWDEEDSTDDAVDRNIVERKKQNSVETGSDTASSQGSTYINVEKRRGRPRKSPIPPVGPPIVDPDISLRAPLSLASSPLQWDVSQVQAFLKASAPECATLMCLLKKEEVDGQAFLLLNLPTLQEHLGLPLGPALKLCRLVERLRFACITQFP